MGTCASRVEPLLPKQQKRNSLLRRKRFFATAELSRRSSRVSASVQKSPEDEAALLATLARDDIFSHLPQKTLVAIVASMGLRSTAKGERISSGEGFYYVVHEGPFTVLTEGEKPAKCCKGESFGKEELMFCSSRFTLKSLGKGSLWALDRLSYQTLLVKHASDELSTNSSLLAKVPILAPLSEDQKSHLADALVRVKFQAEEYICRTGERGNTFYIVEEGTVAVIERPVLGQGEGKEIKRRTAGWYFGEGALQSESGLRNADVRAVTDVSCLQLGREAFHDILGPLKDLLALNFMRRLLRNVPLLVPLNDKQLDLVCDSMVPIEFQSGEYICRQGDAGDAFYIIKEGQVRITESEEGEIAMKEVGALVAGEYFGEGSLLKDAPRRANVIAHGRVECFAITRDAFHKALGPVLHTLDQCFEQRNSSTHTDILWGDLQRIRKLGEGSFGSVYLVRHLVTGETYALKRIKKTTVVAKNQEQCVQNEVKVLRTVNSPFLVNLCATFKDIESVYMLTDVCLGGELYALMKSRSRDGSGGCFPMEWVSFYAANCILAIESLHGMGVVHRDVKPENLLIVANGYAKLADFGLAKEIGTKRTFSLCGTPAYVSPEVYKRAGSSYGVDWWAIGVMICEMASGFSPFESGSSQACDCFKMISQYERSFPNVKFHDSFPDALVKLLLRMLHPNPSHRYGFRFTARHAKIHPFFDGIDWPKLEAMEVAAPYVPPIGSAVDASNFDCRQLSKEYESKDPGLGTSTFPWDESF